MGDIAPKFMYSSAFVHCYVPRGTGGLQALLVSRISHNESVNCRNHSHGMTRDRSAVSLRPVPGIPLGRKKTVSAVL